MTTETKNKPATVNVSQTFNQDFREHGDPQHVWKVTRATNTLIVEINQVLNKGEVQTLIENGVTVNVT
jgi:hypothetical protein